MAECAIFQHSQCLQGSVGTTVSLQHLQEVRGEQCFYLALMAKLTPKSQFQEERENTKESSKGGQKNDPGLKKECQHWPQGT